MIYQFNLSFSLSLLLMGFLLANIFGILTNSKNIIFLFVLYIEIINYFVYSEPNNKKTKPFFISTPMYFFYQPFKKLSIFKLPYFTKTSFPMPPPSSLEISDFLLPAASPTKSKISTKKVDRDIKYNWWRKQTKKTSIILSVIIGSFNFLKIGFEFGFFIDAFKLGS